MDKSPGDSASKILTIEFLVRLLLDLFCLLFGNPRCANADFGFGLVVVWFVVLVPIVPAAVRIPCSQLGIAILGAKKCCFSTPPRKNTDVAAFWLKTGIGCCVPHMKGF